MNKNKSKVPLNKFYLTLGILAAIVAVFGSLYLSLWLCFVGGIVQLIESAKATPVSAIGIAVGILRICLTALSGWGCFFVSSWVCGRLLVKSFARRNEAKFKKQQEIANGVVKMFNQTRTRF